MLFEAVWPSSYSFTFDHIETAEWTELKEPKKQLDDLKCS